MKIFSWMQNKLNGRQGNRKSNPVSATYHTKQEPVKEEFSDWPHGLLAIGTFGNNDLKENPETQILQEDPSSSQDLLDFTPEEVGKLQKELTKLLKRKPTSNAEGEIAELPLDKFLNCPSSLEVDRRICNTICSDSDDREGDSERFREEDIERTISVILGKCRDVCSENNKKAIGKKSISFLLKKMFVCSGGFAPAPSLRDTLQESKMEKLLRTMLHKKIYPQNSSRASSMKKYLEDKQMPKTGNEDERKEKANDGCKWVKTDSESNAVLEGACERVIVGDLYCDIPLGLYVIRGENVVLIGELDLEKEELPPHMTRVSPAEIKGAQKADREASDLKGTMRKRMEFLDLD
ncbi:hypothetical protein L1049_003750 [Liquidambar formosana]|uniref:Sm domain-containing protein n=1 Tax=Liquidambar formosana TaxID=63359 RepID=A0AAP0RME4_LIQFO